MDFKFDLQIEGMQIVNPTDEVKVNNIVMCLYGDPGAGKTSLSFTAEAPILFDFDRGLQRSVYRKTALQFNNQYKKDNDGNQTGSLDKTGYEICMSAIQQGLLEQFKNSGGKTVIIDTGGTLLDDSMTPFLIHRNSKLQNSTGGLSLQGFGSLKTEFNNFLNIMRRYELDVIFICHAKEKDDDRVRPKMTGGSLEILMEKSDLMGYMYVEGTDIFLDFNPSDKHTGKNAGRFPKMRIPHFEKEADKYVTFLQDIIDSAKKRMSEMTQEQRTAIALTESIIADVDFAKKLPELNAVLDKLELSNVGATGRAQILTEIRKKYVALFIADNKKQFKQIDSLNELLKLLPNIAKTVQMDVWKAIVEQATAHSFEYNKNTKQFQLPSPEEEAAEEKEGSDD